jgi:hypothetical protein
MKGAVSNCHAPLDYPYTRGDHCWRVTGTTAFAAALICRYSPIHRNRLVQPLNDALDYTGIKTDHRKYVLLFFLREMAERKRSFWGWTADEWIDSIERRRMERQHIVAIAYLMCGFSELHRLKCDHVVYSCLARKVFGHRLCLKVDGEPIGEQSTMCFGNMQSDEGDMLLDIELAEKITNQDL